MPHCYTAAIQQKNLAICGAMIGNTFSFSGTDIGAEFL
jgi:hypothetical protein